MTVQSQISRCVCHPGLEIYVYDLKPVIAVSNNADSGIVFSLIHVPEREPGCWEKFDDQALKRFEDHQQ